MPKKKKKKSIPINVVYNNTCLSYMEKYGKPEEWKSVIVNEKETYYKVSNYGRIVDTRTMTVPNMFLHKSHYYVYLYINDKRTITPVYRLVALAFIPVPQKYFDAGYALKELVVDHIRDGDTDNFDDNTIWNLQWLTHRENISKAAKCGYKKAYPYEFRECLDEMILADILNDEIYKICKEKFGLTKEEVKPNLQVRRRRLGKTLKEHHENPKEFVAKIDALLKKGLSNDEIIDKLNMSREGRSSERLLQYRRSILKIPAQSSKYFDNDTNQEINKMIKDGKSLKEILEYFEFDKKFSQIDYERIIITLKVRVNNYKRKQKKLASSTTIEKVTN